MRREIWSRRRSRRTKARVQRRQKCATLCCRRTPIRQRCPRHSRSTTRCCSWARPRVQSPGWAANLSPSPTSPPGCNMELCQEVWRRRRRSEHHPRPCQGRPHSHRARPPHRPPRSAEPGRGPARLRTGRVGSRFASPTTQQPTATACAPTYPRCAPPQQRRGPGPSRASGTGGARPGRGRRGAAGRTPTPGRTSEHGPPACTHQ
mmetsp:Transcript_4147/g.15486  ORF Transcript_4147/g.15486 Transcript_4147/m.15486 type:complete len:205 (-) Transcript_4147:266-880(-)